MTRCAIVTASDSGIGKATAVALARAGYDVGITWHADEDGAKATAREVRALGRSAHVRRMDLADLPAAADAIDELADALGGVDVLVNNSGTGTTALFLDLTYDACGPARNATTAAISRASPGRPSGTPGRDSVCGSTSSWPVIGVLISPGATAFTVIPCAASAW